MGKAYGFAAREDLVKLRGVQRRGKGMLISGHTPHSWGGVGGLLCNLTIGEGLCRGSKKSVEKKGLVIWGGERA